MFKRVTEFIEVFLIVKGGIYIKPNNVLFSIIVPAYNSSTFIRKCIESVLNQTYGGFELILVDDGSQDTTLEICKSYAENDLRIKVIHKENGGHTSARNEGLKNATGEYILFLDSDDWIATDTLEICEIEIIQKNSPDIIIYQIYNTLTKKCFVNNVPDGYYQREKNYDKIISSLLMDESGTSAFVKGLIGKVFKKSIIMSNQLAIPHELRIAEDGAAFVSAMIDSSSISVISDARYFYFVREGSVSHSSDKDAFIRLPYLFEYYKKKMLNCEYNIFMQFERYIISQLYTATLLVIRSGEDFNKINEGLDTVLKDSNVSAALRKAKFNRKGYKFIIKQLILRYRLWRLAKLLDKVGE